MARVFLHIGSHKTGTSYLQALFHNNRTQLAKADIHYPDLGPNNAHHALAAVWLGMPDIQPSFWDAKGGPERMWEDLISTYANASGTLFLSAENFSRIYPERVDFIDLRRRLAAFEDVQVIYTMRAQTDLIQSTWMQIARQRKAPRVRHFVTTAMEKRRAGGIPIDHHSVYQNLRAAFAAKEIFLLDYNVIAKHPDGIARAFLDLMGSSLTTANLVRPSKQAANISPDPLALMVASEINRRMPPPERLVRALEDIVHPDPSIPSSLLMNREYARICSRFSPGNAALVELVQPVQPGFTFNEDHPPDQMIYRDSITTDIWVQIACKLYEDPTLKSGSTKEQSTFLNRLMNRT